MQTRTFTVPLTESGEPPALPESLDSEQTLVLAFGDARSPQLAPALARVTSAFPRSQIIGCSTAGEIHGRSIQDQTLVVAVARFEHTRLRLTGAAVNNARDSRPAGRVIAETLAGPDLRAVVVLSDGLKINGSELLAGMTGILPIDVPITGGLAADGKRFQQTWTVQQGRPTAGWVSAVGFYGERLEVGVGSSGGWQTFGRERVVTRAQGNVLYELDGTSALDLYKGYLGDLAAELPSSALLFPLSLRRKPGDLPVVRTVLSVDESAGSMTFAGDLPIGASVHLMRASFTQLIGGARAAAQQLQVEEGAGDSSDSLTLAVSCVGRRLVMGERAEDELDMVGHHLPVGSQMVGFYSYGEIAPHPGGRTELHNQTMTLTHLTEG